MRVDSGSAGSAPVEWAADLWRAKLAERSDAETEHLKRVEAAEFKRLDDELDLVDRLWEANRLKPEDYLKARRAVLGLYSATHKLVAWMRESGRKTDVAGYQGAQDRERLQEAVVYREAEAEGGRH